MVLLDLRLEFGHSRITVADSLARRLVHRFLVQRARNPIMVHPNATLAFSRALFPFSQGPSSGGLAVLVGHAFSYRLIRLDCKLAAESHHSLRSTCGVLLSVSRPCVDGDSVGFLFCLFSTNPEHCGTLPLFQLCPLPQFNDYEVCIRICFENELTLKTAFFGCDRYPGKLVV